MTKRDLVVRVSEDTGLKQQDVMAAFQRVLEVIIEVLGKGEKVELRNFGVFEVKKRRARVGRNPNTPQVNVPIPPRYVVRFKPGKEMRELVLQLKELPASPISESAPKPSD